MNIVILAGQLMVSDISSILFLLESYFAGGTYTSLLDHIYIQNCTIFMSGVLDTYYSDHDAIFADIALHGYQQ